MQLNSAADVARWVYASSRGAQNLTITAPMTGAIPPSLGEAVMAFDRLGHIRAFWRREQGGHIWRWCLHRTSKPIHRDAIPHILRGAEQDAKNRKKVTHD